ncbi:MAG: hypothetical protein HN551_08840 [Tateyamaria sp.]|jgi:UMF1 family MFS transporter|nr:hypothetical protein [Tateyamaria sp.]MBT5301870.1 hypothetical protein [Tateyamaria sp.]MBT6344532.1 hypothetical protein [Tateyamaria sp.]MBT7447121.1 hypothetical protein [Tateyamaria sp.]MBT7801332.1 hypothetical protein [Tateyamaria sp.]
MTTLKCLWETVKALPSGHSLASCLTSSMLERDAVNSISSFSGTLALWIIDFSIVQIGIFGLLALLLIGIRKTITGSVQLEVLTILGLFLFG